MALNKNEIFVCHIGSDIMFVGTEQECKDHQRAQPFRTDCWKIHSLEDYGSECYSEGHDAGYDMGTGNEW